MRKVSRSTYASAPPKRESCVLTMREPPPDGSRNDARQNRALPPAVQRRPCADGGRDRSAVPHPLPPVWRRPRRVRDAHGRRAVVGHAEIAPTHGPCGRTEPTGGANRRIRSCDDGRCRAAQRRRPPPHPPPPPRPSPPDTVPPPP